MRAQIEVEYGVELPACGRACTVISQDLAALTADPTNVAAKADLVRHAEAGRANKLPIP